MGHATEGNLGIYVSVPFCRAKCSFCNFASGVSSSDVIERYVARLCKEIKAAHSQAEAMGALLPKHVDSVYFGGGTPTLLTPEQLRAIVHCVRDEFDVLADAEFTLEAAPGQISDLLLDEALRLGVNRVSLGVQSFIDRECAAVGRLHTGKDCLLEVARLRSSGMGNVGVDLIAGLPYQSEASWQESLAIACGAGLEHISVYMFEVDDDSRLGKEILSGGLRLHAPKVPDDEIVATFYEQACEQLPRSGFAQYEISNFARDGFQSKHNRKYWERAPYLGFGLDAHSMLNRSEGAVRFANAEDLDAYLCSDRSMSCTEIGLREEFEEELFLGLRLVRGVEVGRLTDAYPYEWLIDVASVARELHAGDLMRVTDECWSLTPRGRLISNEVFGHLLAGVTV